MADITVLGIGNTLLQDEGFGVKVVENLIHSYSFSPEIALLDGGTLGIELLSYLSDTRRLIIVDAIDGTLAPGEQYEFRNEEVNAYFSEKVSMHELGIQEVIAVRRILERPIEEIVIVGVQPAVLDTGLELTPAVAAQVQPVTAKVLAQLHAWGVEVVSEIE